MVNFSADLYTAAYICSGESLEAVQRRPTAAEVEVIEEYRTRYRDAFGWPHGLHYIHFPGEPETVAVWFPPQG